MDLLLGAVLVLALAGAPAESPSPSPPAGLLAELQALVQEEGVSGEEPLDRFLEGQYDAMDAIGEFETQAEKYAMENQPDKAAQAASEARRLFDGLMGLYEPMLERYPESAALHNAHGEFLYDLAGRHSEAVEEWKKAEELDPDYARALNNLGLFFSHTGEYERAFNYFERVLELDPKHPDYAYNVAQIYLVHFPQVQEHYGWDKAEVYRKAMALSKRAAKAAPEDYELVADYARNFFLAEQFGVDPAWPKAAKAWQTARETATEPERLFHAWLFEARAWMRNGNDDKAKTCVESALEIMPESELAQRLLNELKGDTE